MTGRLYRKIICLMIALALVFSSAILACAVNDAKNPSRMVRVGFSHLMGYHMVVNHARSGYGYDFLQSVAAYNNWSYNYLGYNNTFPQMYGMLDNGDIQLFTGAPKRPELESKYLYSMPIGSATVQLVERDGDGRFSGNDVSTMDGAKIGIVKGEYYEQDVKKFIDTNGLDCEIVYFPSDEELRTALSAAGKVDLIATSSLRKLGGGEIIVKEIFSEDIYAIAAKGNEELIDELNYGISQMNVYDPSWRTRLHSKYYSLTEASEVVLTADERKYMERLQKNNETIKVAINPDNSPYSWSKDGRNFKGIIPAILELLQNETGLNFEILEAKSRANYEELISSGQADIVADACDDLYFAESKGFKLTNHYFTTAISKITRTASKEKDQSEEVVAAPFNKDFIENRKDSFYKHSGSISYYQTLDECIGAVKNKDADACYVFQYTAQEALNNDLENKLQSTLMPGDAPQISMAISSTADYNLMTILNRAIGGLGQEEVQNIMIRYASITNTSFSLIRFFYTHPMAILVIAIVILLILFTSVMSVARRNHTKKLERTNEALTIAVAKAEHAMDARTRFFAQMSHEIRTPMNAIVGLTELSRAHLNNPDMMSEYLDKIASSSKVLLSIINDVLDMSSIESNKMKIASVEFDLNQVLDNIEAVYTSQCKAKGLTFILKKNISDQHLVGDSLRINQILLNLVSNSYKFTESGGRIELVASEISRKGDVAFIRFTVEDTGSGMTDDMVKRIFVPFEQESALTARKHGGSGLGMSITKNLVDLMDGTINVESAKDVGTRFTVDLPFKVAENMEKTVEAVTASGLSALLVGSDAQQVEYLQLLVEQFGVKVTDFLLGEAGGHASGEEKFFNQKYNICILDELPSREATKETLAYFKGKLGDGVMMVLASSKEPEEIPRDIKEQGIDRFIKKPILQGDVSAILSELSSDEEAGTEQAAAAPAAQTADDGNDFGGREVLLAEDNEINAEIMMELLDMVNIKADHAENGRIALEKFEASEPGRYMAVLMDLQMPEMDGIEAAKAIRASSHPDAKEIPIVAQSANAFNEDVANALGAGMNAHVSKPINSKELYATLKKCRDKEF